MSQLPALSAGVALASAPCGGAVYDALRSEVHLVNPAGLLVLDACRTEATLSATTDALVVACALDRDAVAVSLDQTLARFAELELVGRRVGPTAGLWTGAPPSSLASDEHFTIQVAGVHRIRFRSTDGALINDVRDRLALDPPHPDAVDGVAIDGVAIDDVAIDDAVTDDFHLTVTSSGGVTLVAETQWNFPSREALLNQLVFVVTDYLARSTLATTIHSGAARSPAGQTVVFPGVSGAGKSTLVGGLIQAGWDYLSDESVCLVSGVRSVIGFPKPLRLSASSCAVLGIAPRSEGGDDLLVESVAPDASKVFASRPPVMIVAPEYRFNGDVSMVGPLDFRDALCLLVESCTNLRVMGDEGLASLCDLAAEVPAYRITYGSTVDAMNLIDDLLIGEHQNCVDELRPDC